MLVLSLLRFTKRQENPAMSNTLALTLLIVLAGLLPAARAKETGTDEVRAENACAEESQSRRSQTDYTLVIGKLKAAIRKEVEQKQLPAFSVSLVEGETQVWAEGFGYQDAQHKVPATADTVYRVGSVSKVFTDIAVMQLVEEGRLNLDEPVEKCLPAFAPRNPFQVPITLRQLMSHRSGLVRESPVGHYFDPDEPTLAASVASLNSTTLVYKPETRTKYSNAAVAVVGAVLESQLDVTHPERVRQMIFDPLQMASSSFIVTPAIEPRLATGWMRTYDGRRFEAPTFLLGTGPAGNLYSSVTDLSKFLICLFNDGKTAGGQILKPQTLQAMTTPITDSAGKPQGFGLGFHVQELDGYKKIGHGGAVYGFSTQLEALPERKLGVAAVAALDVSNGVVERLANYALRLMIAAQDGKPLPEYRTTGPVPPERARELVGLYREASTDRFARITEFNCEVFMRLGSFRHELRSAADDGSIIVDDAIGFGAQVKQPDAARLVVGDSSFERIRESPPAEIPTRWKGLIGEYGWDHDVLYILEDDGRLYALIEWIYYYPLKEVSENVFEFPDYGLYHGEGLKFTRGADGVAMEVNAAEVRFVRREIGAKDGETFKITPVKPIDELRAAALAATPPPEKGDYRDTDLVDLVAIDPTIKLDIRYATTNNFAGAAFYKQPRAWMQRPAAAAVARANVVLKEQGLGLLIHDAYRPWHVTKMFWDATPEGMKQFVANPATGSRHNRGCAVDLTLYELESGQPVQMVSGYDEFSPRAYPMYPGGTARQRWHRELLRRTMQTQGFTVYEYEWWHFDFKDWKMYRIGNVAFDEIR
jgi:CubicO group peptidase (beta-lactamase class C family)/D-alanyl-D-alanine dipeptidase